MRELLQGEKTSPGAGEAAPPWICPIHHSPGMSGTGTSFWSQRWSEGAGEGAATAEGIGTGFRPPSSLGKEGVSLWHDVTGPSAPQKLYFVKYSSSSEKITEVEHVVQQRIPH